MGCVRAETGGPHVQVAPGGRWVLWLLSPHAGARARGTASCQDQPRAATRLCWPLGTLYRERRPGSREPVLRGRSPPLRPARCRGFSRMTLYLVTPLRPARAEAPAQECLGPCGVGHNTEVALGERPRGLDPGRRTPPATEAPAGGPEGPGGPGPVHRPKGRGGHTRPAQTCGRTLGPSPRPGWRRASRKPAAETGHGAVSCSHPRQGLPHAAVPTTVSRKPPLCRPLYRASCRQPDPSATCRRLRTAAQPEWGPRL